MHDVRRHIVTVQRIITAHGPRWRAMCSCGWRHAAEHVRAVYDAGYAHHLGNYGLPEEE